MAYGLLNRLKAEGKLGACSILVSDESALRKHRTLFGRDINRVTRSYIEFRSGETGHEKLAVPMESVEEIELKGRTIYRKKKRIKRIYPR
jgi:hypothetical protein